MMLLQLVIALGLLNVWLIRFNRSTAYRGGSAHSMREEFAAYGLPSWSTYAVGTLKIAAAIALLVGIWVDAAVLPAALIILILMAGAISMHVKVKDSFKKSIPALSMLVMSGAVVFLATR